MPAGRGGRTERAHRALRAWYEVRGSPIWILTTPGSNLTAGVPEYPDKLDRTRFRQNPADWQQPGTRWLLTTPDANLTTAEGYQPDKLYGKRFRENYADWNQPGALQNLLFTVVVGPDANLTTNPGYQPERFFPKRYRQPQSDWFQQGALANVLYPGPFNQKQWLNPALPVPKSVNRSWLESGVIYIGQDRLYAGPGQVPAYDWQNPRPRQRAIDLRTWAQMGYLTALNPPAIEGVANQYYAYLYMDASYSVSLAMDAAFRVNASRDVDFFAHLDMT